MAKISHHQSPSRWQHSLSIIGFKFNQLVAYTKYRYSLTKSYLNILWSQRLSSLQKGYGFALLLFYPLEFNSLAILMAGYVLLREFWPKLTSLWDRPSGKLIIIFFYAVILNFSLVNAASLVNEVTGISANYLPYTHNFAVLLLMPQWFFGITLILLVLLQLWFFSAAFLHLIRKWLFRTSNRSTSEAFPLVTTIVKCAVVSFLVVALADYSNHNRDSSEILNNNDINIEDLSIGGMPVVSLSSYKAFQTSLLHLFIYHQEADQFSRCELGEDEHAIELNPREILVIKPNDSGFETSVTSCKSAVFPLSSD